MRVIMTRRWTSPHGSAEPGDELDLPDEQARKLIEARAARAVGGGQVRTRPAAAKSRRRGASKRVSGEEPAEDSGES